LLRPALIFLVVAHLALPACQGRASEPIPTPQEPRPVSSPDCTVTIEPSADSLYTALKDAAPEAVLCLKPGTWTGTHVVERPVTIKALEPGTVVLDAGGEGPVLGVMGDGLKVVLQGLTLKGGSQNAGGAIALESRSEVQLIGCTLTGNSTGDYGGGALFARMGVFVLKDCRFEGNKGQTGGAILADGISDWEIEGGVMTGNVGERGGAIAIRDGARVVMSKTKIEGNTASEGGGAAIWLDGTTTRGPELTITGGTVTGGEPAILDTDDRATIVRN
jgi:hypothetical protein